MQTLKEKYFDRLLLLLQRMVEIDKNNQETEYFSIYHYVHSFENQINYSFSQKMSSKDPFDVFVMKLVFKKNNKLITYSKVDELETGASTIHIFINNTIAAEEFLQQTVDRLSLKIKQYERESADFDKNI